MKLFSALLALTLVLGAGCSTHKTASFASVPPPSGGAPVLAKSAETQNEKTPLLPVVAKRAESKQIEKKPAKKSASEIQSTVTPDLTLAGRVLSYVSSGQFAVLSFPIGRLPMLEQRLAVYRAGQKVGV
ncbi:MAG: hypothetical protein EPO07_19820, partial [Verrucomicrobia bacterium]